MIPLNRCRGCHDDFYNHRVNCDGKMRCWSAKSGRIVTRYRIGTWTTPTTKGAFTEVRVPSCYKQQGFAFYDRLPDFVKASDLNRARRSA